MRVTSQSKMEEKLATLMEVMSVPNEDVLLAQLCQSNEPEMGICMETNCIAVQPSVRSEQVDGYCDVCHRQSVLSVSELLLSV